MLSCDRIAFGVLLQIEIESRARHIPVSLHSSCDRAWMLMQRCPMDIVGYCDGDDRKPGHGEAGRLQIEVRRYC